MLCTLYGIKRVDYQKRDTGERKQGLELHCCRSPYPTEGFTADSVVCFTEYLPINESSASLANEILKWPLGSKIDLVYIQSGRFSSLIDVTLYK